MANELRTKILMPDLDNASSLARGDGKVAQLEISTSKASRGGVQTFARLYWIGNGSSSFEMFGDYGTTVEHDRTVARVTAKALESQHARNTTPEKIEQLKAAARAFYENKRNAA